jgi:hypothetical protein
LPISLNFGGFSAGQIVAAAYKMLVLKYLVSKAADITFLPLFQGIGN